LRNCIAARTLRSCAIQLSHAGKSAQIAVQAGGQNPVYPTAQHPLAAFNGTVLENGAWTTSLQTLLGNPLAGWAMYYEYIVTWRSASGTGVGTVPAPQTTRLTGTPGVLRFGQETLAYAQRSDGHLIQFYRPADDARWKTLDLSDYTKDTHALRHNPIAVSMGSDDSIDIIAETYDGQLVDFSKRRFLPWTAALMPALTRNRWTGTHACCMTAAECFTLSRPIANRTYWNGRAREISPGRCKT